MCERERGGGPTQRRGLARAYAPVKISEEGVGGLPLGRGQNCQYEVCATARLRIPSMRPARCFRVKKQSGSETAVPNAHRSFAFQTGF